MGVKRWLIGTSVLVAVLVLGATAVYGVARYRNEANKEHVVAKLKKQVARDYFDPESVRFRDLKLRMFSGYLESPAKWLKMLADPVEFLSLWRMDPGSLFSYPESSYTLCGELNAKNRLGAYVGYARFEVVNAEPDEEPVPALIGGDGASTTMNEVIDGLCGTGEVVARPPDDPGR